MESEIIKWSDKQFPQLKAINLELTNHCNYKCSFCLNHYKDFRSKGFISEELVNKVIGELNEEMNVSICGIGEPSLHPDFLHILKRLSTKFNNLSIVTNGHLFKNNFLINAVLDSNIKKINLSLDYIDKEQYRSNKGGDLEKVLSYIKDFLKARAGHNNKPLIQINYLYEKDKDDYAEAINFFKSFMEEPWCIYIRKIKNLAGQLEIDEEKDEELLDNTFKEYISSNLVVENWNRYLINTNFRLENPKICRHIYDYYMLLWNGDIVPCCVDFNNTMTICNALSDGINLNEVFYSQRYNLFRTKMECLDFKDLPLCRECNDYFKV